MKVKNWCLIPFQFYAPPKYEILYLIDLRNMPSLELEILDQIHGGVDDFPIFVETGTKTGETTLRMETVFEEVHTIEIKTEFYERAKNRYRGNKISFHLGDSSKVLRDILVSLERNTVFYLDGHWSANNTGKGEKDCPLKEELECIASDFDLDAIVIIDDFRLFGMGPNQIGDKYDKCNWEDISKHMVIDTVGGRLTEEYHLPSRLHPEDRFVIHLKGLR